MYECRSGKIKALQSGAQEMELIQEKQLVHWGLSVTNVAIDPKQTAASWWTFVNTSKRAVYSFILICFRLCTSHTSLIGFKRNDSLLPEIHVFSLELINFKSPAHVLVVSSHFPSKTCYSKFPFPITSLLLIYLHLLFRGGDSFMQCWSAHLY